LRDGGGARVGLDGVPEECGCWSRCQYVLLEEGARKVGLWRCISGVNCASGKVLICMKDSSYVVSEEETGKKHLLMRTTIAKRAKYQPNDDRMATGKGT